MKTIRLGVVLVSTNIGGTELSLLRLLRSYPRPEFEPHLCTLGPEGALAPQFRAAGIPLHALEARGPFDWPRLLQLKNWIGSVDPDVLHGYLYGPNLLVRVF